jgi:hypothetical protein
MDPSTAMFTLDRVVPWGRSFEEYRRMFALSDADLRGRVLGCADGPASFNAEATRRGSMVISVDPLYRFDGRSIRERITATCGLILDQLRRNMHEFVWDGIGSVEELGRVRMKVMEDFLADYDSGKRDGRYLDAELPDLAFPDRSFDLAVCSHFLFLYSDHLSAAFHRRAILELCRVAAEVRIFPLLALGGRPSPHLPSIIEDLSGSCEILVETVPYEFQRGANQMMRLRPLRRQHLREQSVAKCSDACI